MSTTRPSTRAARLVLGALLVASGVAVAGDVFDFIPPGGRTLLLEVIGSGASPDEARALLTGKRTPEEWLRHLREHRKAVAGLQRLEEKQLLTLADYLSFNMPLAPARIPATPTRASTEKVLPPDGRDMVLDYCQGCHIITVVVTQDRSMAAWLGTMNKPSHVQIKLTRTQREALASYLVVNAAIPIDQVPEELRAGGASY
jgi:mono/diheme cytochrome c family protein